MASTNPAFQAPTIIPSSSTISRPFFDHRGHLALTIHYPALLPSRCQRPLPTMQVYINTPRPVLHSQALCEQASQLCRTMIGSLTQAGFFGVWEGVRFEIYDDVQYQDDETGGEEDAAVNGEEEKKKKKKKKKQESEVALRGIMKHAIAEREDRDVAVLWDPVRDGLKRALEVKEETREQIERRMEEYAHLHRLRNERLARLQVGVMPEWVPAEQRPRGSPGGGEYRGNVGGAEGGVVMGSAGGRIVNLVVPFQPASFLVPGVHPYHMVVVVVEGSVDVWNHGVSMMRFQGEGKGEYVVERCALRPTGVVWEVGRVPVGAERERRCKTLVEVFKELFAGCEKHA